MTIYFEKGLYKHQDHVLGSRSHFNVFLFSFVAIFYMCSKRWEDHTPCSGARKTTSGGLAICISACEDHQLAADTTVREPLTDINV